MLLKYQLSAISIFSITVRLHNIFCQFSVLASVIQIWDPIWEASSLILPPYMPFITMICDLLVSKEVVVLLGLAPADSGNFYQVFIKN